MSEKIIIREKYYPNRNLMCRDNYKDGKQYSLSEWWYKDGNLGYRINFKDGKYHGLYETWNYDGVLDSKKYYFNGKEITEFEYDVLKTCGEFNDG